jgi:serine/threonine-protein kinase
MELVPGETLSEYVYRHGPMQRNEALAILRQVGSALEAAHAAGIIHRDLKGRNIILAAGREGRFRAVVTDFGIAAMLRDASALAAGTAYYVAPEQLAGAAPTPASDLFSLAVVAHEAATGSRPELQESGPARLSPKLDRRWRAPIVRCLHRDPDRRYQNVTAFLNALDADARTRRNFVIGGAIAGAGGLSLLALRSHTAVTGTPPAVAVMPFEVANDTELANVGEGLAGDITRLLALSRAMFVIGEASTVTFAGLSWPKGLDHGEDEQQAAQRTAVRLHVQYVLFGSMTKSGGQVAVDIRLRSGSTGTIVWRQSFSRRVMDMAALRGDIAPAVAAAIKVRVPQSQAAAFARPMAASGEAYEAYLLGRACQSRRGAPNLIKSVEYFRKAVELEPQFAYAWAALAISYNILAGHELFPLEQARVKLREYAERALALDATVAEAYAALALMWQRFEWKWDTSEQYYQMAFVNAPQMSLARQWHSGLLSILRRPDDAVAEAQKGRDLEPLAVPPNNTHAAMLFRARKYPDAVRRYQFTLELNPGFVPAMDGLGGAYLMTGDWQKAIQYREEAAQASGREAWLVGSLGYTLARAGQTDRARKVLGELEQRWGDGQKFSPSAIGNIYKGLGKMDAAFDWYAKALAERDPALTTFLADPENDDLRGDPRFWEIVKQLNL